ncbi:hypothetical protein I552_4297 [Mycobacterium xenopi 3993]|nr:hypothetical protein I552_4297 [Mycobacterium xenopi 3993]
MPVGMAPKLPTSEVASWETSRLAELLCKYPRSIHALNQMEPPTEIVNLIAICVRRRSPT